MWWNGAVKRFRIRGKHPWWNEGVERMDDEVEVSLLARFPWGTSPYLIGRSGVEEAFWRGLLRFPFFFTCGAEAATLLRAAPGYACLSKAEATAS